MKRPALLTKMVKMVLPAAMVSLVPFACTLDGSGLPLEDVVVDNGGSGGDDIDPAGSGGADGRPNDPVDPGEPECPYTGESPVDVNSLPTCPGCSAGGAHCLPTALVPDEFQNQLDSCDADSLCVPDEFIQTTGLFIPTTCESVAGAEGRCLSPCLPQVAEQAANLPQSTCSTTELCVPCYDPQTGESTGACDLSCDPGPSEPPVLLPECCAGDGGVSHGTCVPKSAAGDQAERLGQDTCPDGGDLVCAPNEYVDDQNYQAPDCTDFFRGILFGSEFSPGKCLSNCIPEVAEAPLTGAGDCEGENVKCVPSISPLDKESTGACDD